MSNNWYSRSKLGNFDCNLTGVAATRDWRLDRAFYADNNASNVSEMAHVGGTSLVNIHKSKDIRLRVHTRNNLQGSVITGRRSRLLDNVREVIMHGNEVDAISFQRSNDKTQIIRIYDNLRLSCSTRVRELEENN